MKWLRRTFRVVWMTALALILLAFATVQFQQHLLRYRAERLMHDMRQIRLYQSTWDDAQRLMRRWGAWGHYDGTCTSADCSYQIALSDLSYRGVGLGPLFQYGGFLLYSLLGGRTARLSVSFTVHNGTIWRQTAGLLVTATPKLLSAADDLPLTLIIHTKARQRLRPTGNDWWIMGTDEQLADHPYYKAGRPGGCEINCEEAVVTYSTRTPPAEIDHLTSFNFSCLTRFSSCMELDQLLPAARDWHLYDEKSDSAVQETTSSSKPCDIPLWAIARDTRHALIVEGVSIRLVKQPGLTFVGSNGTFENGSEFEKEEDSVRIVTSLKGISPWKEGSIVVAHPNEGVNNVPTLPEKSKHLFPGSRYIVFPIGGDRRDQVLTSGSPIELNRCGVWEDTPGNRRGANEGIAQNDELDGVELP